jgi:3-oxoacyl-[acyl-carrier-protein] synthase-3
MISAGAYKRVLVVAADLASCGLNWDHLESSAIFGDGVAAVVLGSGETGSQILASSLKTYSEGAHYCEIPRVAPATTQVVLTPAVLIKSLHL